MSFVIDKEKKRERFDINLAQGGVIAIIAFINDNRFGTLHVHVESGGSRNTRRHSVLTKKTADDVEDKAIRMRQVNEGGKARVRSVYYVF